MAPKVFYIFRQRNSQALEESPPFLVALASRNCKEQTCLFTLPFCTPKLAIDLTLKRSHNHRAPPFGKFEMLLFQEAPPLNTNSLDILSCSDVGG